MDEICHPARLTEDTVTPREISLMSEFNSTGIVYKVIGGSVGSSKRIAEALKSARQ